MTFRGLCRFSVRKTGAVRISPSSRGPANVQDAVDWAEFYKDELDFRRIVLEALKE
jgi:hypothetical protein